MLIANRFQPSACRFGYEDKMPQFGAGVLSVLLERNDVFDAQKLPGFNDETRFFQRFPLGSLDNAFARFHPTGGNAPRVTPFRFGFLYQ